MGNDDFVESDGDIGKVSKYDGALSQIYRLNDLWNLSHRYCLRGLLEQLNWVLDRIYLELAGDLEESDENIKKFDGFTKELGDLQTDLRNKKITLEIYKEKFYKKVMDKELFLRRLQNKLGKGSSYEDSLDDYWDK